MQDQDNIAQTDIENNEIKETARETGDVLSIPQASFETVENPVMENAADENVVPQNTQEIPTVEYVGEQESEEIPTVTFNTQDVPETAAENNEFQTVQSLEISDAPKDEELFMFNGYELKTWEFNPRIYKILTGSTIFCVLALVAVAQSNILNTKACDAPMVSKVCQVLDTVYVGSVLFGTDSDWVNEDYDKTELGNSEITYIDTSNVSPPLPYPEGYFALANPEMMYNDPMIIPGSDFPTADGFPPPANFPPSNNFPTTPNNPVNKPAVTPTPNKNKPKGSPPDVGVVVEGDNPIGDNPIGGKPQGKTPDGFPTTGDKPETAKTPDKQPGLESPSVEEFRPNKKPLKDYAKKLVELRDERGTLDLSKNFSVELNATLTDEGKFDEKKSKYGKIEGDEEMVNFAKDAMEALGSSQMFYYLKTLGVEKVNFTIVQNETGIYAVIKSSQPNTERAKSVSSGFNGLLLIAKNTVKPDETDTLMLLKQTKVSVEGNNFVINVNLDKNTAQALIKEQLDKAKKATIEEEKQKAKQSNSAAQTENGKSNAGK